MYNVSPVILKIENKYFFIIIKKKVKHEETLISVKKIRYINLIKSSATFKNFSTIANLLPLYCSQSNENFEYINTSELFVVWPVHFFYN